MSNLSEGRQRCTYAHCLQMSSVAMLAHGSRSADALLKPECIILSQSAVLQQARNAVQVQETHLKLKQRRRLWLPQSCSAPCAPRTLACCGPCCACMARCRPSLLPNFMILHSSMRTSNAIMCSVLMNLNLPFHLQHGLPVLARARQHAPATAVRSADSAAVHRRGSLLRRRCTGMLRGWPGCWAHGALCGQRS